MAMQNVFNILVDLKVAKTIPQPLVTQNDSVVFILEVMQDGVPFDLTDTTIVSLAHTRKDQTVVVTPGTKAGNKATFVLGTNETSVTGAVTAKAQFYDVDGRVSTLSFSYQVGLDPTGVDYVPSEVEQTLIQVVMADAQAKIDELSAVDVVDLSLQLNDTNDELDTAKTTFSEDITFAKSQMGALLDTTGSLAEVKTTLTNNTSHNAFPSIVKFNNLYYIFYRLGAGHLSYDGKIVVKTSSDMVTWSAESIVLQTTNTDYRDPSAIVFNGKLVLKYFYRISATEPTLRTCLISTTDMVTWSTPVVVPSPGNAENASRGNMAIKDNRLYMINYVTSNSTYVVSTSDLVSFTINTPLLLSKSNEASIAFVNNKFVCVLRQYKIIAGFDYNSPIVWGESADGVTWKLKELPIMGHCPSLQVLKVNEFGTNRLLVTYRDPSQLNFMNRNHFNFALFGIQGEMFSSRIYNIEAKTGVFDMGYGDSIVVGADLYIVYYSTTTGGSYQQIKIAKFLAQDVYDMSAMPEIINKVEHLDVTAYKSRKKIIKRIMGEVDVSGNGTATADFTINLAQFNITTGLLYDIRAHVVHSTGSFTARIKTFSNTSITGLVRVDTSTFSTSVKVYWSAVVVQNN